MPRVIVAEPFAESGLEVLRAGGVEVVSCVGAGRAVLLDALRDADGLVVRSETRVDRELLGASRTLAVVGRAGVGVDAIDVPAATDAGIVVLNTPAANTIAATEQTFALMLALQRNVAQAVASIKRGEWNRAPFIGHELYGKTLGIVGLGRIGGGVALRARAFGMQTIACDPFIAPSRAEAHGVELVELNDLLAAADIVTLHVPLTEQTKLLIDAQRLARMRPDALLINCARGGVVDESALLAALDAGKLRGAAIDVVADEPPSPQSTGALLHRHELVVATPHLGGSTREALARIATELAADIVNVLRGRPAAGAVNAPIPRGADAEKLRPYVDLAYRIGALLPQLGEGAQFERITLSMCGEIADLDSAPVETALLSGLLQHTSERRVSVVNAAFVAAERGLSVAVRRNPEHDVFTSSLGVEAGAHAVVGTSVHGNLRLVDLDGFEIDANPVGPLVLTRHQDVPGMIGRVGTILGDSNVNISTMQVSRNAAGGEAMMVLAVDRPPDAPILAALAQIPAMRAIHAVRL